MNPEEMFRKSGAILEGHFILTSGLHSPVYWEKFKVMQYPEYVQQLCGMIAKHFGKEKLQLVAGPTTAGIILAFETARQLGIRAVYAEKAEGKTFTFKRGALISPGDRILVVDDILTTGGSIREVITSIKERGGIVAGVAVLVDRTDKPLDFGAPLFSCLKTNAVTYTPDKCPLCAAKIPLVKPGGS
ncbi:MAG: orotate phosphoribosyltransferase [Dehalococcoidales bacterium]|nr:orotate phosphoribosyltransferase [Dehalococcoidales bacterium]